MKPLLGRLREMLFHNTNRMQKKGFFQGATQEEQEQLKRNAMPTILPKEDDNKTITEE